MDALKLPLNPDNPILAVDLNNTLMDQIAGIVRASKGRLTRADFAGWDVDNSAKMGMSKEQYLAWAWQNPYSELLSPPFHNADRQLFRLHRAGVKIWIVTATVMNEKEIAGWLWCNGIVFDRIIKTRDKVGIGDLLIDDSPTTCEQFYSDGLPILRYRLAWNEHLGHIPAISW